MNTVDSDIKSMIKSLSIRITEAEQKIKKFKYEMQDTLENKRRWKKRGKKMNNISENLGVRSGGAIIRNHLLILV